LGENLSAETLRCLELAAAVHDIGIRPALEKYGRSDGKLQEQEGSAPAKKMLLEIGVEEAVTERVAFLVGRRPATKSFGHGNGKNL